MKKQRKRSRLSPKAAQKARPAERPASLSLWSYIAEMHAPVEDVRLSRVSNGMAGWQQDGRNIRGYFKTAQERLNV